VGGFSPILYLIKRLRKKGETTQARQVEERLEIGLARERELRASWFPLASLGKKLGYKYYELLLASAMARIMPRLYVETVGIMAKLDKAHTHTHSLKISRTRRQSPGCEPFSEAEYHAKTCSGRDGGVV
jgi:hypothetical protein